MVRALVALLVCLSSCATLNTAGMSPACRDLYNACLNSCPAAPAPQPGQLNELYPATAACTKKCNDDAQRCR